MHSCSPDFSLSPKVSFHLDAIRSLAALAVVAGHLRSLFFLDYRDLNSPTLFVKSLYFFTGFGHSAVMVFFVLSGFLVSQSIYKQRHKKIWTWEGYLIQRFSRLIMVLWPALLLTYFLDSFGMSLFGLSGIYGGNPTAGNIISWSLPERTTLPIYLANGFFLQNITAPTAGSNGALWSLANECLYYLLFPLVVMVFGKGQTKYRVASVLVLFCSLTWFLPLSVSLYFGIWIMGATVALGCFYLPRKNHRLAKSRVFSAIFLVLSLNLGRGSFGRVSQFLMAHQFLAMVPDFLVGIATAGFLFFTIQGTGDDSADGSYLIQIGTRKLSQFSYSLYLTHLPVLVFLQAWLVNTKRWQPTMGNGLIAVFLGGLVVSLAYVFSLLTEAHTDRLRPKLMQFFKVQTPGAKPQVSVAA